MTGGHEGGNPTDSTSAAATSISSGRTRNTTCADKGVDDDEGRAT